MIRYLKLDETENRLHMPTVKLKFFEPNMYNSEKRSLKLRPANVILSIKITLCNQKQN